MKYLPDSTLRDMKIFIVVKYLLLNKTLAFISDVNWLKGANEHCNNQINTQNCI